MEDHHIMNNLDLHNLLCDVAKHATAEVKATRPLVDLELPDISMPLPTLPPAQNKA